MSGFEISQLQRLSTISSWISLWTAPAASSGSPLGLLYFVQLKPMIQRRLRDSRLSPYVTYYARRDYRCHYCLKKCSTDSSSAESGHSRDIVSLATLNVMALACRNSLLMGAFSQQRRARSVSYLVSPS